MSKKFKSRECHWHRIEFYPTDKPNARMILEGKYYDGLNPCQNAVDAFNRRFGKPELDRNFTFEAVEHCPKGVPFTPPAGDTKH